MKISYDIFWKDLITIMLDDFTAFCLPDLHQQIDYSVPPVFLEQEFDKLISDLKKRGMKFCDKLVKVHLKNGTDRWLFIHIEIQKQKEAQLPQRMFIYFYRIYDKYGIDGTEIEAIVVFLHQLKRKRYKRFEYKSGQTGLVYDYRTMSIFDYEAKALEQNKNPFALVILASQQAVLKDTEAEQQLEFKRRFTRMAFERGISKHKIATILQFVYYAIELPTDLNLAYETYFNELLNPHEMTTLQAAWNETWRGEKFDMFFSDILNERITTVKEDMNKKFEESLRLSRRRELDAKREKDEAKREKDEAKRKEEDILRKSVIKLHEKELSATEIAETLEVPEKLIIAIIEKSKKNG